MAAVITANREAVMLSGSAIALGRECHSLQQEQNLIGSEKKEDEKKRGMRRRGEAEGEQGGKGAEREKVNTPT
jgi:hypothetical protein